MFLFSFFCSRCSSSDFAKEIEAELRKSFENLADEQDNNKEVIVKNNKEVSKPRKDLPPVIKKFAKPMYNKNARDDPKCPSEFKFETLASENVQKLADKITCSKLVLEIAHLLFCRQWKLICHSPLPYQKR